MCIQYLYIKVVFGLVKAIQKIKFKKESLKK